MTTTRNAFGAVLGTVTDTAKGVSTVINTGIAGVNMLHELVNNAQRHQRIGNAAREVNFETRLEAETARDGADLQFEIEQYVSKSERHNELFQLNLAKVQAAISAAKATL